MKSGNGEYEVNGIKYELKEEYISDFYYELKHFKDLVDNKIIESPIMSKKRSLDIIKITNKE